MFNIKGLFTLTESERERERESDGSSNGPGCINIQTK